MIVWNGSAGCGARRARLTAMVPFAVILWMSTAGIAHADTCTWTGNGADNLWSTAANWTCNGSHPTPQNGDIADFTNPTPHGINVNDINDLHLDAVHLVAGGGQEWQISGNAITVSSVVSITSVNGFDQELLTPITLDGNMAIMAAGTGTVRIHSVALNGFTVILLAQAPLIVTNTISGAGSVTKNGPEPLYLEGDNTYTGPTTILQGELVATAIPRSGRLARATHGRRGQQRHCGSARGSRSPNR